MKLDLFHYFHSEGIFTSSILASIVTILVRIVVILRSIEHLQVQYLRVLFCFEAILMNFKACGRSLLWNWLLKLILTENILKIASKVLWQYSRELHLQVNTFFKYWLNTRKYYHIIYEYCHNTCKYWAGEYNLNT